jgi:2-polyprenyl-3-methyl-5-hydroxy-6-metoxy-1,4-benzoquinol methylase
VKRRHERGMSSADVPDAERWNHNIQYHPLLLDAVPPGARRVLDVGCGDGQLTRQFATQAEHVVGIDLDEASIGLAIEHTREPNIEYVRGDVLDHPFEPGSFDAVVSVATLHHMGTASGLRRFADLVRPGGVVAVIGIGRPHIIEDLPWQIAGTFVTRYHRLSKHLWEHTAPIVWPPPHTNRQVRAIAAAELHGGVFRRHVLWRYSLIWTKPPRDR